MDKLQFLVLIIINTKLTGAAWFTYVHTRERAINERTISQNTKYIDKIQRLLATYKPHKTASDACDAILVLLVLMALSSSPLQQRKELDR